MTSSARARSSPPAAAQHDETSPSLPGSARARLLRLLRARPASPGPTPRPVHCLGCSREAASRVADPAASGRPGNQPGAAWLGGGFATNGLIARNTLWNANAAHWLDSVKQVDCT